MKTIRLIWIILILSSLQVSSSFAMAESESISKIQRIFDETKEFCDKDNGFLWGRTLDVPILLVDKANNKIYSNQNSTKLDLTSHNDIFSGELPNFIEVVKGPAKIGNKTWAIIPLPLPKDKIERQCIILHEAFHCLQPELDLKPKPYTNSHMDEMDARFWLKLEWKALEYALQSDGENRIQAITDAICFRNYRRSLYSNCDGCENRFEIHEGMAEYTAQKICRSDEEIKLLLKDKLKEMWESPSFVNCFAYVTGPAYAFLLDNSELDWRTHLGTRDDIAILVQSAYEISLPFDPYLEAEERSVLYSGAQIMGEELDREIAL